MVVVSRRYHLHWPGLVFVVTTLLVALGAINSQLNLLYWIFGVAVGALLFSGILSGAVLMGVEVQRMPPERGIAGTPMRIRYRVTNRSRIVPALALHIEEWSTRREERQPTWADFCGSILAFAPWVPRRGTQIVEAQATPEHRGRMTFCSLRVSTTFPFGITRKSVLFTLPAEHRLQETLIRPQPQEMKQTELATLASHAAKTESSPQSGIGTGVPVTLREFAAGDSPRRIAWKRSALRVMEGRNPLVRQEARSTAGRLWIVLRSSGDAGADEIAIRRAAGVLQAAAEKNLPVGFSVPDADVTVHPSAAPRHVTKLQDGLATLQMPVRRSDKQVPKPHPRDMIVLLEGDA